MLVRPPGCELIFQEDDALIHGQDPEYEGVDGWWKRQFPNRVFRQDWEMARPTEMDGGDIFTRVIRLNNPRYKYLSVTFSFDGYAVYKSTESEASWQRECDHAYNP